MATQQQQQQQPASAPPPKDRKNKKRQTAAAEAANNGSSSTQSAASTSNPAQSNSKPAASPQKRRFRSPAKRPSQPREAHEMYGVELPVPPSPRFPKASAKGKEKAVEPSSHSGMEEGEVDPLEGLFFVDTKPRELPKDLQTIEKPVISPKKGSTPLPALEKSPSLPPQSLLEDKIVPDYVGTSSESKEVDLVKDDGVDSVEGSSKDLLDAIIKYSSFEASQAEAAAASEGASKRSQHSIDSAPSNSELTHQLPEDEGQALDSATQLFEFTSPGGTKRKREEEADINAEANKRHTSTTLLGDLLSDDDSTSSEDEKMATGKVEDAAASESDGDSSAQEDPTHDDIALNMAIDTVGKVPEPQLDMEVDLTGSAVREEDTAHQSATQEQPEASKDVFVTDIPVGQEGAAPNEMDDDIAPPEGVENDEYTADRSRYFKEDDPLKLCARCGETGHTVRDCAHVQCLTCGKLDDHGTRSCPLTMTCFRCNSRGHHIKDCPLSPEEARNGVNQFCERCSSHTHKSSTCPYIWRVYIRAADAPSKPPKIHFACYNCASAEHFGDDCKFPRGHPVPNSERTAFTIDPDNNRKSHIRFDNGQANNRPMPRPNIVNGSIVPQRVVSPPPSHAPRGPRAQAAAQPSRKERRRKEMARPSLEEELRSVEEDRRRHGDFGNLGDLEAGEIDEDEDEFEKRLDKNKNEQQQANLPKGPRPGARDRRRAREGGSKSNTAESSVNGDAEPKKSFQPFKHFTEPPGVNGHSLNRPTLSRSPPAARRREGRQPSPIAMDSPAQARSAEQWKRDRGLKDRVQGGRQPARSGGGGGGFASGSLLDRIDRGSSNSTSNNSRAPASRDPRVYDSPVQRDTRPWSVRAPAPPESKRRANGYTPHPEPSAGSSTNTSNSRRGGNPHYKGGYF